jgi:2-amino-4-hydroxy-6-hydroxymethyldihydropteridine diphosphokinase
VSSGPSSERRIAQIALGSNLPSSAGDRLATLAEAVRRLAAHPAIRVVRVSSAYETDPVPAGQPAYLNAAATLEVGLEPEALLEATQAIERELGRDRRLEAAEGRRWGPRTIDLDLLLVGESRLQGPGLTLPHPGLAARGFVLVPLVEIAPDVAEPVSGLSIRSLLDRLAAELGVPADRLPGVRLVGEIPYAPLSRRSP